MMGDRTRCRVCYSGLAGVGACGAGAAQLEVGPLPGAAGSKLLSPLWQGLLKVCLVPQTFPTHLNGWGTASLS